MRRAAGGKTGTSPPPLARPSDWAIASRMSASRRGSMSPLPVEDPLTVGTGHEDLPLAKLIVRLRRQGHMAPETGPIPDRCDRQAPAAPQEALVALQQSGLQSAPPQAAVPPPP